MDKNIEDIVEAVTFIRDNMATKDDLAELRTEFNDFRDEMKDFKEEMHEFKKEMYEFRSETKSEFMHLRAEVKAIHTRLEEIEKELANHTGFAKEIDHLLERIRAIEAHLDIHPSPFSPQ